MKSFIWVTAEKSMLHCYPDAPSEVHYLKYEHRHLFKVRAYIQIEESRDIEFMDFKNYIENVLGLCKQELPIYKSCENISDFIYEQIKNKYPNRDIKIEVSEDGENGSYIEYPKS